MSIHISLKSRNLKKHNFKAVFIIRGTKCKLINERKESGVRITKRKKLGELKKTRKVDNKGNL